MITDSSFDKFKYILCTADGSNLPLIVVLHGSGEIGSRSRDGRTDDAAAE